MMHSLTHSTSWTLEKLTRKGDKLFAYLLDGRHPAPCDVHRYCVMFCYVVSFQVIREQCVGLECYDHDAHILKELPQSSYLLLLDEYGTIGYKHFRLQAANYIIDVIADVAPTVQLMS